ncbi:MFS transporter [Microvirga rosea]|uniref:MFS transporter n=1 Tax=Microvirga rosea TaxID=2715425 RepID=UPI001D0B6A31|nr:MFS transporter [Microvirga rosea]MCB8820612.1 MFS transporter [Microvirga rosea]
MAATHPSTNLSGSGFRARPAGPSRNDGGRSARPGPARRAARNDSGARGTAGGVSGPLAHAWPWWDTHGATGGPTMKRMRLLALLPKAAVDRAEAWLVVGLLFLFMLINFADRAVLGLAAGPIMRDLGLSNTQFGLIATSFFTLFSFGAVIGGFLVNRVAAKWVLAALALVWSLCQLPLMLSATVATLVANRIVLGFGEGPAYPVAAHAAYKWFPSERRALPTSVIAIGALAGNGIAAPVIVAVIAAWSWQAAFGLLGVLGLIWCAAWLALAREGSLAGHSAATAHAVADPAARLSYRRLLGCRTIVGVLIVGFTAYWLLTLAVIWLPTFLTQAFGYTSIQAGWIMMLVSLGQIVLLPAVSALSDGLKRLGAASRHACGSIACASTLAAGLVTILLSQSGGLAAVACTIIAFSLGNVIFVLGPVLVAEVTPVGQRGAALGIVNAITTLAGPLAPAVTGMILDVSPGAADGIRHALLLAGAFVILGALAGFGLIDPEADRARDPLVSPTGGQPA